MESKTKDIQDNKNKSKKETIKNSKNKKTKTAKNNNVSRQSKKNYISKKTITKNSKKTPSKKKSTNKPIINVVEYYDLPYRYNETIVKTLYQTPNTLFVYWDISDQDREHYIKQYGENFFNTTRPVLIIHNESMNYSFEIPINDFANSWYLHINDSKCDYKIELGRRPIDLNNEKIVEKNSNTIKDYICITTSNKIETPNDHILYTTNENNTVKFRNIKNNNENSISLVDIITPLSTSKEDSNNQSENTLILKKLYSNLYQNKNIISHDKISNPSSSNTSSGSMPIRIS